MSKSLVSLDKLGIWASALCLVHCFALPFLVGALSWLPDELAHEEWIHALLLGLIMPVGALAFIGGYRHHRLKSVLASGLVGLFLVSLPLLAHEMLGDTWEAPLTLLGSFVLIGSHWKNHSSSQCCHPE